MVFACIDIFFKYNYKWFYPLCKVQDNLVERDLRSRKASMCFYKFFYFLWATCWGYSIIKDTDYMPWTLGGKGEFKNAYENYYFYDHEPQLANYFLITSGYHVSSLITHLIENRRNDFLEMGLHHIVALYLFGGAYFLNFFESGAVIAVLHDISDIGTNWCKFFSDTPL